MLVLGIMNGTSGDGIDYVWTEIRHGKKFNLRFLHHKHKAFSRGLRLKIKQAVTNKLTTFEVGELHHELGREYAAHYKTFRIPHDLQPQLIGLHGQTVFHKGGAASLQIGEPSYLAMAAGMPVVFNFRAADIANGGEGAPLAPVLHRCLLDTLSSDAPVAFHNLGGISNLTYCHKNLTLAFDTGPSCTLMDIWLQSRSKEKKLYDEDGRLAAKGLPDMATVKALLTHPYFKKHPPKSCGREEFNLTDLRSRAPKAFFRLPLHDQMATLSEFTAVSIHRAYTQFLPNMPRAIFCAGGGAKNKHLMERLKIHFGPTKILQSEDLGWPSSAIEGGAFALLAYLRLNNLRVDLKTITGGSPKGLLGQVCEY